MEFGCTRQHGQRLCTITIFQTSLDHRVKEIHTLLLSAHAKPTEATPIRPARIGSGRIELEWRLQWWWGRENPLMEAVVVAG